MQILTNNDNNILVSINQSSFDTESLAQKMEGTFVNDCAKDIIHIVDNTQTPSTLLSTSTEFTRFPTTVVSGNLHSAKIAIREVTSSTSVPDFGASRLFANGEPLDGHYVPNESVSVGERLNTVDICTALSKEFVIRSDTSIKLIKKPQPTLATSKSYESILLYDINDRPEITSNNSI